jgi:glyoxylase-like metal-dependent hydrolase (beta-lactamase superfamily II)
MKLHSINTGYFKLDGGAMFGVVPKVLWQKTNPAEENNLCNWAMRSLLIEDGDRLMLIDTGIGNKQSEKFFSHFYLHGEDSLDGNLKKLGFNREDITDVFLTHLHFDHCGGAIEYNSTKDCFEPAFKNATYWSNELHWQWATQPNPREKASFLAENILPIQESGQLQFIERKENFTKNVFPNMDILFVDGHTESMMIPHIQYQGKEIIFMADLLPSVGHIPLPYVMGYDTRPLITLKEKDLFLRNSARENTYLFLQHDAVNEMCTLEKTEKGIRKKEIMDFNSIFS